MAVLAVLDTNVLVSALISRSDSSPTVRVLEAVLDGAITPLYHEMIIAEYEDVLGRPKFGLQDNLVQTLLAAIMQYGVRVIPTESDFEFPDEDDRIFYEITLSKRGEDARLVTGNKRHFPAERCVVTPAEMIKILEKL